MAEEPRTCRGTFSGLIIRASVASTAERRRAVNGFLPQLVFLAIGGSIAPPLLLLTVLFLGSQRPLINATALALGYFTTFTTCAVMSIAGLAFFGGVAGAGVVASMIGRDLSATVGGLLIVLGLRSLKQAPEANAQPPRWIESMGSMSPPTADCSDDGLTASLCRPPCLTVGIVSHLLVAECMPSCVHRATRFNIIATRCKGATM